MIQVEMESYRFQLWVVTMNHVDVLEGYQAATLWSKQVNTVNKMKGINLNKQLLLLPWQKNSHAIKNSRCLWRDMRHISAEKQHLIRAVAQCIPHYDTHSNSAWGLTPPERGSWSEQHNHTGMRTSKSLLPTISLQQTHTHRTYALHQYK